MGAFSHSLGQKEPCHSLGQPGRSTSISGPAGLAVGTSGSGQCTKSLRDSGVVVFLRAH